MVVDWWCRCADGPFWALVVVVLWFVRKYKSPMRTRKECRLEVFVNSFVSQDFKAVNSVSFLNLTKGQKTLGRCFTNYTNDDHP